MTITYRTTDHTKWGLGKEAPVTKVEIDNSFWTLSSRITNIENNPVQPAQISNITLTGTQLSVHMSNGVIFGPYTIPVGVMVFRGEWTAVTEYSELNIVNVPGSGLYMVLQDHTSEVSFNPAAVHPVSGLPLYHWMMYTSPPAEQLISYSGNRTLLITDANQYLRCTGAVDSALIVPPAASVPFPPNTVVHHRTAGAGRVTLTAGAGVTLIPPYGQTLVTPGAGATVAMKKVDTNVWDVMGHTEV